MLEYESKLDREGYRFVVGIDEAGRGPLAGPVVAAAVLLKDTSFENRIADSKLLSPRQRTSAFLEIYDKSYVGVGIINEKVIDAANILEATYFAMHNAISNLILKLPAQATSLQEFDSKVYMLIDGNSFKTDLPYRYQTIVKGDGLSLSIACASIVAKVTRDRILAVYDKIFPCYQFIKHKGYPTAMHRAAIKMHGPSLIHRRSFRS